MVALAWVSAERARVEQQYSATLSLLRRRVRQATHAGDCTHNEIYALAQQEYEHFQRLQLLQVACDSGRQILDNWNHFAPEKMTRQINAAYAQLCSAAKILNIPALDQWLDQQPAPSAISDESTVKRISKEQLPQYFQGLTKRNFLADKEIANLKLLGFLQDSYDS
jgi:hypothetical protein